MQFAPATNKDASQTCQNTRIWALLSPSALPSPPAGHASHPRAPKALLPGQVQILRDPRGARGPPGGPGIRRAASAPGAGWGTDAAGPGARPAGGGDRAEPPAPPGGPRAQPRDPRISPPPGRGRAPRGCPGVPAAPEPSLGIRDVPPVPGCFPAVRDRERLRSLAQPSPAQPGAEPPLIRAMSWAVSALARPSPGLGSAQPQPPGRACGPRGSLALVCLPGSQLS